MAALAERVADAHGIQLADLLGPGKRRTFSYPRQAFMALALDAGRSTTQVGRFLRRDHTTVIHGARSHRKRLSAGVVDALGRET